jgi:2-polyprenyl-3-methyl-5-hydroxy-6-metoxy-1,4-benzoquinol methylase
MSYIEKIHDKDWRDVKKDYSFFEKEARFRIISSLILSEHPKTVLDVGCGSGYLAFLLEQENPRILVHGFDVSLEALKLAISLDKKYKLDINYENIPENDSNYDMVVCSEVLEHLFNIQQCLMEINRILKHQGKVVITVPNFSFWRFRIDSLIGRIPYVVSDERHIQTFNKELLTKRLNEAGFDVLQLIGTRVRWKFLLKISISFFSETLIVVASKRKPLS